MRLPIASTVLLVIDVQRAFDEWEAEGKQRNNPVAVERIGELLAAFRARRGHVIHVRHASRNPGSRFHPDRPGYAVKAEARELPGETVIVKHVNSSFIGTELEDRLRRLGIVNVVIVGATTSHCVESTTRMTGNLGFQAKLVRDATWTFDQIGVDGERYSADQVHAMTLANLNEEFAEIVTTADVISALE